MLMHTGIGKNYVHEVAEYQVAYMPNFVLICRPTGVLNFVEG